MIIKIIKKHLAPIKLVTTSAATALVTFLGTAINTMSSFLFTMVFLMMAGYVFMINIIPETIDYTFEMMGRNDIKVDTNEQME
jgi:hypothetical protein